MTSTRRDVLKTGGLAALVGVTGGLAGCTDGGLLASGGDESGSWQYDPAALVETQNRFFGTLDYAQLYDNRQYLPESSREDFETDADSPLDAADIGELTGVGAGQYSPETTAGVVVGSAAITGEFGADEITEAMGEDGESDAEQVGEYEGYALYENAQPVTGPTAIDSGVSATFGVGDGAVVMGVVSAEGTEADVTGRDAVEQMIDASNGEAPLLADDSEYAGRLTDALDGQSMEVGGEVDPELVAELTSGAAPTTAQFVDGIRAVGFGANVAGETTTFTFTGVYEDEETADDTGIVGVVNAAAEQAVAESQGIDDVTASRDGALVSVEMSGETKTIFAEQVPDGGTTLSL
ncbi:MULTISPECIES: hypothetical protein [Salinibaculum]|uniref:hypothetical protein n=1 Tax=Salinibaculum TaxID=2732368 RepID=UPI0030D37B8F